jgi:ubiquinone/menaquinone biosynthesis C-methylase UbiE
MGWLRRRSPVKAETGDRSRAVGREPDWRAYDSVAADYARVLSTRLEPVAADLVALAGVEPGWRVLDVGTGTGVTARAAAAAGASVVGVDAAPGMLRVAAGEGISYAAAAAIDLPFAGGTFDAIVATFVLSHFAAYDTALFDMLRVLRPGGRIGVATWAAGQDEFLRTWQEVAEEFADRRMLRDARTRAMPWDETFSHLDRLTEALHRAGLRRIRAETRGYRFDMSAEDYLTSREIGSTGRFLREMLGSGPWGRFRARARQVFAERFPPRFRDFREVNLAVGTKP